MMLNLLNKILFILLISSNCYATEQLVDFSDDSLPIVNEMLRKLQDDTDHAPRIYTGTAAPTSIPQKKGDIFLRTDTGKVYVATDTDTSVGWKLLN